MRLINRNWKPSDDQDVTEPPFNGETFVIDVTINRVPDDEPVRHLHAVPDLDDAS